MTITARAIGATFLFTGLWLGAACSSSPTSDGQSGGAGDSETGGRSQAGGSGRGGSSGKGGAPSKAGASGKAGSGAEAGDSAGGEAGTSGASGAGGEAGGNACAACPSGLCLPTGECVACLPSNDQCPDGQYCSDANTCLSGCKGNANCASGVCSAAHNCQNCISDQECGAPDVCGASQCAAACTVAEEGGNAGCSTGLTCCGTHCVDAKTDSQHCGVCGTACAAGQLCGISGGGSACLDSTLAAVCSIAKLTVVTDGQDGNTIPARAIANALTTTCVPAPTEREVSQDTPDAVNTSNGRPVAGGDELLIAAGGFYFSHLTTYVSTASIAPIYAIQEGANFDFRKKTTNAVVVSTVFDGQHDSQDVFVIQFMRDPSSGSLILNAQGLWQSGTTAAAYYFINVMLPTLATQTKSWYVLRWTDANADLLPNLNEFTAIDSGN